MTSMALAATLYGPEDLRMVERPLDLEVTLPAVPVRGGTEVARRLFQPLGYDVTCTPVAAWGPPLSIVSV